MTFKKLGKEGFIEKSRMKHGDKYDYSSVVYVNTLTPVDIVCPIHGDFPQTPKSHMRGRGCPKCGRDRTTKAAGKSSLSNTADFVAKSKKRFGNKFDYSKTNYEHNGKEVEIICPIHKSFWMTPTCHLKSTTGCQQCSYDAMGEGKKLGREGFIRKSKEIHGDRYSYDKVMYTYNDEDVLITCFYMEIFHKLLTIICGEWVVLNVAKLL